MSAHPYEDLALCIAVVGLALIALAAATYLVLALLTRRRLLPLVPATLGAFSLLVLIVLLVVRVHGYAGRPSACFYDENAIDAIVLLAPLGFVASLGALFVARAIFDGRTRRVSARVLGAIACALTIRWLHVLTLDTYESADATISKSCTFDL